MKRIILFFLCFCLTFAFISCTGSTKHKLTVVDESDMLIESVDGMYASGDTITIKTHMIMDGYLEFSMNGKVLDIGETAIVDANGKYTHWEFYITMPDEDITLTYKIKDGFLVD